MASELSPGDDTQDEKEAIPEMSPPDMDTSALETPHPDPANGPGAEPDSSDSSPDPPLHGMLLQIAKAGESSIDTGSLHDLRRLIDQDKSQINAQNAAGDTALHIAAQNGLFHAAEELIKAKANVSAKGYNDRQPLHDACSSGYVELVKLLLGEGADIEAREAEQNATPLSEASLNCHDEVVDHLLQKNANTQVTDKDGWSPLFSASLFGQERIVRLLLDKDKSNLESFSKRSRFTALNAASYHGHTNAVTILLEEGAALDTKDTDGCTPLMNATLLGHADIVRKLLEPKSKEKDVQLETTDNEWRTPLLVASEQGDHEMFVLLLDATCSPSVALHFAAAFGDSTILQDILARDSVEQQHLSTPHKTRPTVLHSAFKGRQPKAAMKTLLESTKLNFAKFEEGTKNEALEWAMNGMETEDIAKSLVQKWQGSPLTPKPPGSEEWGVMKWAVHEELPQALTTLISCTKDASKVKQTLESELKSTLAKLELQLDQGTPSERFCGVLWVLIAASDPSRKVSGRLGDTLKKVKHARDRKQNSVTARRERDTTTAVASTYARQAGKHKLQEKVGDKGKGKPDHNRKYRKLKEETPEDQSLETLGIIADILEDPPFAQMHKDSQAYELPKSEKDLLGDFEATVVGFFKREGESGTLRRDRTIKEVIYDPRLGPTKVIEKSINSLHRIISKDSGLLEQMIWAKDHKPQFMWVHLPSTNMAWMNDLLTRIMHDDGYDNSQYRKVRSFFKYSWLEFPDRKSASRIMRPRTVVRKREVEKDKKSDNAKWGGKMDEGRDKEDPKRSDRGQKKDQEDNREQGDNKAQEATREQGETVKEEKQETRPKQSQSEPKTDGFTAASAIYMPYFCFSTHCQPETSPGEKQKEHDQAEEFRAEKDKYDRLLQEYEDKVIHGSPTLDEWYYHFADDEGSTKDKDHRNETQVVTTYLRGDNPRPARSEPLKVLRVNQLWVWTIADKWLITANSFAFDKTGDNLVQGVLERIATEAEYGGSGSQPQSATDMSRLIVDYCIGSYDRRPKDERPQREPSNKERQKNGHGEVSIGQTFSHYLNEIARTETNLFTDFRTRTEGWQNGTGKASEGPQSHEDRKRRRARASLGGDIRKAIKKAEKQYCDIKDVRDELNILKSVALHQRLVQRQLAPKGVRDADLLANHVVADIGEMEIVAERIQSAVNTTLSLQQSEMAIDQGKILMVFTFATILFLPLSFLTSLFALDVDSFLNAPPWALVVIFVVSTVIAVFLGLCAVFWERIIAIPRPSISDKGGSAGDPWPPVLGRLGALLRPKGVGEDKTEGGGEGPEGDGAGSGAELPQRRRRRLFRALPLGKQQRDPC